MVHLCWRGLCYSLGVLLMTSSGKKRNRESDNYPTKSDANTQSFRKSKATDNGDLMTMLEGVNLSETDLYHKAWNAYYRHPVVVECREMLMNGVVGNGVCLQRRSDASVIQVSDSISMFMCNYYEVAARNALSWLFVTGVVPVFFEKTNDECDNTWVPIVPDYTSVDVFVQPVTWQSMADDKSQSTRISYKCVTKSAHCNSLLTKSLNFSLGQSMQQSDDCHLFVMQFSLCPPTSDGEIVTPLASCTSFLDDMERMTALKHEAERSRAHPPIVVAHSGTNRRMQHTEAMPNLDLVAGAVNDVAQEDAISRIRVEYVEDMPFTAHESNRDFMKNGIMQDALKHDPLTRNAIKHKEEQRDKYIFLPRNHVYVNQHLPQVPEDYIKLLHEHEDRIRRTIGLPSSFSGQRKNAGDNAGSSHSAQASSIHQQATMTINRYRMDINMFLKRCFAIAGELNASERSTEDDDTENLEKEILKKVSSIKSLPSDSQVALRTSPLININVLQLAVQESAVSKEKMTNILLDLVCGSM